MRCDAGSRPFGSGLALAVLGLAAACGPLDGAEAWVTGCPSCHPAQAAAHAASRHRRAGSAEVFVALRARQAPRTQAFCDGCHRPNGEDGLSCLTCHAAIGNTEAANGRLVWDRDGPLRGPGLGGDAPHATKTGGIFASAELCGTCHEVAHGTFTESPYTHWLGSPARRRGEGCPDCHLGPRRDAPAALGGPVRSVVDHTPRGLLGDDAVALLGSAVALEASSDAAGAITVTVTVTHRADGHELPDGASFSRRLWLEAGDATLDLGTTAYAGDREVASPLDADRVETIAVPPAGRRSWRLTPSAGAFDGTVRLRFQRVRPELLDALSLPAALAGPIEDVLALPLAP